MVQKPEIFVVSPVFYSMTRRKARKCHKIF